MSRSGCWICFSAVWSLVCTVYFHKFQFPALRPSVARSGNFKYFWLLATASQRHWWVISNATRFWIIWRFLCSAKQGVIRICRNPVFWLLFYVSSKFASCQADRYDAVSCKEQSFLLKDQLRCWWWLWGLFGWWWWWQWCWCGYDARVCNFTSSWRSL